MDQGEMLTEAPVYKVPEHKAPDAENMKTKRQKWYGPERKEKKVNNNKHEM